MPGRLSNGALIPEVGQRAAVQGEPLGEHLVGVLAGPRGRALDRAGVALNRGAGAGWMTPPSCANVPRA